MWTCVYILSCTYILSKLLMSTLHCFLICMWQQNSVIKHSKIKFIHNFGKTNINILLIRNSGQPASPLVLARQVLAVGDPAAIVHHSLLQWWHGLHLESTTSYQKSDLANQCLFTCRTILPNFIPIWFEMMELFCSNNTTWTAIWNQLLIQKLTRHIILCTNINTRQLKNCISDNLTD